MKAIIDNFECQRDSPRFRQVLEENEKDLDNLEGRLEKVVKQCNQMVAAGRQFNHEQDQLIHTLWDLAGYFNNDTSVQSALNRMLSALQEAAKYHAILVDQAARAVTKNLSTFIKKELRPVKDLRQYFEKVSGEMDSVLQRSSGVSRSRTQEALEINNLVIATRRAFRHTTVDYVHALSIAQGKKKHEVVDALLSYLKAYSTFYHQGTDLCDDLKPSLDKIGQEVHMMRQDVGDLEKSMENRHTDVTDKDLVLSKEQLDTSQPVRMHGYLFKRTTNAFKTWNRRYFTLQNNQLVYRKRSGEEVTVMEEDLRLCTVKPANEVDRRFCFEVVSPMKCHMLQAESEDSYESWINALQRGIGQALQLGSCDISPDQPSDMSSSPSLQKVTPATPGDSSTNSSPAATPQAPTSHKAELWQEIMSIPGNELCCDCGHPSPRWASINLGITLCIECSGIHRSLGVHYSKVRSLTLDAWEPEVLKVMRELGNTTVNTIYQAQFLPSGAGPPPAKPDSHRSVREEWIKAKYVERRFLKPLPYAEGGSSLADHSDKVEVGAPWSVPRRRRCLCYRKAGDHTQDTHSNDNSCTHPEESQLNDNNTEEGQAQVLLLDVTTQWDTCSSPHLCAASQLSLQEAEPNVKEEPACSMSPNLVLFRSCEAHNLPMMSRSLALGADKNWHNPDEGGRTPLHQAIDSGCTMAVQHLLNNGTRINEQDSSGRTPLHLAVLKSNIGQVCLLLKHRVDLNITDAGGHKAIDLALESSEPDVVTLLRVASLSEHIDRDGGGEDNNVLTDFLRDFQEKMVGSQGHNRSRLSEEGLG